MNKKVYGLIITLILSFIVCINNTYAKTMSEVNVGDYIKMTPTATSYEITSALTGYDDVQTINPSELNLWRVIRKNEDGTVDVASEYASNEAIYFSGKIGYMNLVEGLNEVASQYTNQLYVEKTRHMGYSNQKLKCIALNECPPDTGYEIDANLVKNSFDTLVANTINGEVRQYFLASRDINSLEYYSRFIDTGGNMSTKQLVLSDGQNSNSDAYSLRPILTLKKDITLSNEEELNGRVLYDLDSIANSKEEDNKEVISNIKNDQNWNKEEPNEQVSTKSNTENPNTGSFVACIFILTIILSITIIFNANKSNNIFKL